MTVSNRETARDALTALLSAALTGTSGIVQEVYGYRVADFAGKSPVVVVSSAGSQRKRRTMQGSGNTVYLQVDTFVLYADGDTWGEDDAEDRLDAIEAAIAGVISDNENATNWYSLRQDGRSNRVDVPVGGVEYAREVTVVAAEVMG